MRTTGCLRYFKVMWPALCYLICYLIYILCYNLFYAPNFEYWDIAILVIPTFFGILFVFPILTFCHLIYVVIIYFGSNKAKAKLHFISFGFSLALTIISYITIDSGYYPTV